MDSTRTPDGSLQIVQQIATNLLQRKLKLATAESCTGGWVAQELTALSGSSNWFERGFVCYSNESKMEMLSVSPAVLNEHGAVSEACARALAEGAIKNSRADVSVAITGVAGPTGGSEINPVGTVWFGWSSKERGTQTSCQHFPGDRQHVRQAAVMYALQAVLGMALN